MLIFSNALTGIYFSKMSESGTRLLDQSVYDESSHADGTKYYREDADCRLFDFTICNFRPSKAFNIFFNADTRVNRGELPTFSAKITANLGQTERFTNFAGTSLPTQPLSVAKNQFSR